MLTSAVIFPEFRPRSAPPFPPPGSAAAPPWARTLAKQCAVHARTSHGFRGAYTPACALPSAIGQLAHTLSFITDACSFGMVLLSCRKLDNDLCDAAVVSGADRQIGRRLPVAPRYQE